MTLDAADGLFMKARRIDGRRASTAVFIASVLLAIPTSVDPSGPVAGPTYLAGLAIIVAALWRGTTWLPSDARRPWLLASMAASCWFAGDAVQRVLALYGIKPDVGPPDVFWIASYPLLIAAVISMIRARGLPGGLRRELSLDVAVMSAAAGVGVWHLIVAPSLDANTALLTNLVTAFYPLGDVAIFALALTLMLTPGRRGGASLLFICCLGLTLPLDIVQEILPHLARGFNGQHVDGAYLVVNGLLGAAAVHPGRSELTRQVAQERRQQIHRWRVVLLGTSLCTVSVVSAIPAKGALNFVPSLIAGLVVSLIVMVRFYGVVREREVAEEALLYQVRHDQLTGAANRTLLMDHLSHGLRGDQGSASPLTLFVIDLDHFKDVNDTWGHRAGDEILREVTRRLTQAVRDCDIVARVGGDEFVVVCHGIDGIDAESLGYRIRESLQVPIEIESGRAVIGASVGVLTSLSSARAMPGGEWAADDLLRRADSAMYEAKRGGGGVRLAASA